jgi:hypothetical protein
MARLLEHLGRREEARQQYVAARDCDGLPMRCVSEFQDAYREAAARHPRAILVDGPAVLGEVDPRGVAGDRFFNDGFHPSLNGHTTLACAILDGLRARGVFGWAKTSAPVVVSSSQCAAHFDIDAKKWAKVCDYASWFYEFTAFARFESSGRLAKSSMYREAAQKIESGFIPEHLGVAGIGTADPPISAGLAAPGSVVTGR